MCVCPGWCAAVRIDLNGIIDLLYSLITPGISRPDWGFSLLTGLRNPLLREQPISSQLISDKPMEFFRGPVPSYPTLCALSHLTVLYACTPRTEKDWHLCVFRACIYCLCEHKRMYIFMCVGSLHVYLCMYMDVCAIVYVSSWPLLWPFP